MFLSKLILMALTLMGSVKAAALNKRVDLNTLNKRVDPNTQSCFSHYYFVLIAYNVYIGVPWNDGAQCSDAYNALYNGDGNEDDQGTLITDFGCNEDNGNYHIWFNDEVGQAGIINAALEHTFPSIQGGFNCPNF